MESEKKRTKHKSCSVFAAAEKRHAEMFSLCTNLCVEMWLKSWNTGTYSAHCKKEIKIHLGLWFFSVLWSSAKFISALFQYNASTIIEQTQHKDWVQRRQDSALCSKIWGMHQCQLDTSFKKIYSYQKLLNTNWAQNEAILQCLI